MDAQMQLAISTVVKDKVQCYHITYTVTRNLLTGKFYSFNLLGVLNETPAYDYCAHNSSPINAMTILFDWTD